MPSVADDVSLTEAERTRGRDFAAKLSMRVLARTWQMLLKGIEEVAAAGRPLAAAEMVLVRIAYAADLPTPDEVIRSLAATRGNGSAIRAGGQPPSRAEPRAETHAETVAADRTRSGAREPPRGGAPCRAGGGRACRTAGDEPVSAPNRRMPRAPCKVSKSWSRLPPRNARPEIKSALERDVRLVRFEDGRLEIALEPSAPKTLTGDLSKKLAEWTGRRWMVVVSAEAGRSRRFTRRRRRARPN